MEAALRDVIITLENFHADVIMVTTSSAGVMVHIVKVKKNTVIRLLVILRKTRQSVFDGIERIGQANGKEYA